MQRWNFDNSSKKKVRGLKRKCRTFIKYITEYTDSLPNPDDYSYLGYWHLHLPDGNLLFPPLLDLASRFAQLKNQYALKWFST
jgi:hypothetical protein